MEGYIVVKALCVIPARKGSKRFPRKNYYLLGGKPLFLHTVEAALNSGCFSQIILSTNDEEIIKIAKDISGIEVWERDEDLSTDEVRAKDVVYNHLIHTGENFDFVSMLMVTSPFRKAEDIRLAFKKLIDSSGASLISVVKYEFQPSLALKIKNNRLVSYFGQKLQWIREDAFQEAYHPNGAIFLARVDRFLETKTFLEAGTIPFVMSRQKSIDIDSEDDLLYAEFILDKLGYDWDR